MATLPVIHVFYFAHCYKIKTCASWLVLPRRRVRFTQQEIHSMKLRSVLIAATILALSPAATCIAQAQTPPVVQGGPGMADAKMHEAWQRFEQEQQERKQHFEQEQQER